MCGIAGILERRQDAPELRAELDAALTVLALRGPDGEGRWLASDRRVAFGHRRLSIIDLSERDAQPMLSADGTRAVAGTIHYDQHVTVGAIVSAQVTPAGFEAVTTTAFDSGVMRVAITADGTAWGGVLHDASCVCFLAGAAIQPVSST